MQDQVTRAAALAAIAQLASPADSLPTLAAWPAWNAAQLTAACTPSAGDAAPRWPRVRRLARFARSAAHNPIATGRHLWRFAKTAGRTCRYLWTVRAAIPWPVRALLAVAMVIKCLPLDFGTDEALTLLAVLLLQRLRPGLMRACWQEARTGKPARCGCLECGR